VLDATPPQPNPTFDLKPMLREDSSLALGSRLSARSLLISVSLSLSLSVILNISPFALAILIHSYLTDSPIVTHFIHSCVKRRVPPSTTVDDPEQPVTHHCNARSVLLDQISQYVLTIFDSSSFYCGASSRRWAQIPRR
jgi:hypothetical protein